jgi:UDP-N-acetylglucosamine 2-epimerase (non-hydrolysing)
MPLPEIHLVFGAAETAATLAVVADAMRQAELVAPVLIAAGPAYPDLDLQPDLTIDAEPLAGLIPALTGLWTARMPAVVLVAADDPAGMAAALAAAWTGLPVAHLGAGVRDDGAGTDFPAETHGRMIGQVAALQMVARPVDAMNLLDEGVPAGDLLITGNDTLAPRRAAQAVAALAGLTPRPAPMPVTIAPAAARFGG